MCLNIKELNNNLQKFWNDWFNDNEAKVIDLNEMKIDNKLDEYLKYLGDNSKSILDIGTGLGYCLIKARLLGSKVQYCLGVDTSINAINYAVKTCELSNINDIEFKVGGNSLLETLPNESFDGIICSNVLDVIPEETSTAIIEQIKRIMKPNGIILLKLNFYLTDELIEKLKMEKLNDNSYAINGILRGVNYRTETWINKFEGYSVVAINEYERIKNGPKDRVIVLKNLM